MYKFVRFFQSLGIDKYLDVPYKTQSYNEREMIREDL